jgi:hypothetical protein
VESSRFETEISDCPQFEQKRAPALPTSVPHAGQRAIELTLMLIAAPHFTQHSTSAGLFDSQTWQIMARVSHAFAKRKQPIVARTAAAFKEGFWGVLWQSKVPTALSPANDVSKP